MMGDYIATAFGPLHHVEFGGTGSRIVLVHGNGGSTSNWLGIARQLRTHGAVSAVDLPGFGLSPPGKDFSMATHGGAVESYIETVGAPVTLVGNSTGGLLAEIVAAKRPDLIDNLVLISPATPPVLPDPRLDRRTALRLLLQATPIVGVAMGRWLAEQTPERIVQLSMEMVTHKPGRVPVDIIEASIDLAATRRHYPWAQFAAARTARSIAGVYVRRGRFARMVRSVEARAMIVHGLADHIVSPTAVEWLASLRPDWELHQMEDTGHTPMMDAPLRTLEIIEPWLARRYFATA